MAAQLNIAVLMVHINILQYCRYSEKIIYKRSKKSFQITNITCNSLNLNYIKFTKCQLNSNNEDKIRMINIYGKLMVKSLNNIMINAKLFRKVNKAYRPFLYNDVIDFCGFQKSSKLSIFWNIVLQEMMKYSNINHTCPYEHDIIIENLILSDKKFKMLPFPIGEYKAQYMIITSNTKIGQIEGYFANAVASNSSSTSNSSNCLHSEFAVDSLELKCLIASACVSA
ncbi:uncharacterized protein ACRADG_002312 [Cochliomyia hominivorax]